MIPGDKYHKAQARFVWLFVAAFVGAVALCSVFGWVATVVKP